MRDRAASGESRVVRCKFRVFYQRDRISRSESSRGYRRLSRASARFRRIFISRAKRGSAAECSLRPGRRTRRKENFSARREITFTAQRVSLIFRVAETIPEENATISLTFADADATLRRNAAAVVNLVLSYFFFFPFVVLPLHFLSSRL